MTREVQAKKLYNMDLHETIDIGDQGIIVTRVPGGWIYETGYARQTRVFVPYNDEFLPVKKVFEDYNE